MKRSKLLQIAFLSLLTAFLTSCEWFEDLEPDPPAQDVGTLTWDFSFDVEGLYAYGDPAIGTDGTIYFGAHGDMATWHPARIYAVNANGTEKWHTDDLDHIALSSQLAVGPSGTIYAIGYYTLYAINPTDGSFDWTWEVPTADNNHYQIGGMAIGSDGTIFLAHVGAGSYQRKVFAVSNSGQTLWINSHDDILGARHLTVGPDGNVYAQWSDWDPVTNTTPYLLVSMNPTTGAELWRTEITDGSTSRGLAFDGGGNIIFSADAYPSNDKLVKIDRISGAIISAQDAYPGHVSISSNGTILINAASHGPNGI